MKPHYYCTLHGFEWGWSWDILQRMYGICPELAPPQSRSRLDCGSQEREGCHVLCRFANMSPQERNQWPVPFQPKIKGASPAPSSLLQSSPITCTSSSKPAEFLPNPLADNLDQLQDSLAVAPPG